MIKPVIFKNQNQELVGILHLPNHLKQDRKTPGVVMFHGFTGNKTEAHRLFVQVARRLCDAGFTVLRFDFRGSGDSDGEFEDMTLPGEVDDAKAALTFLTRQRRVDRDKIGVIGLSMGGRVATILASEDDRVKFAVLYSAALGPLRDRFLSQMSKDKLEKLNSGEAVEILNGWYLKKSFFDTVDYLIPFNIMSSIRIPMLIIHGDQDFLVPLEEAERGYGIINGLNDKNELYIVKGGDHTFSKKEHTIEVINKTLSWLSLVV